MLHKYCEYVQYGPTKKKASTETAKSFLHDACPMKNGANNAFNLIFVTLILSTIDFVVIVIYAYTDSLKEV